METFTKQVPSFVALALGIDEPLEYREVFYVFNPIGI